MYTPIVVLLKDSEDLSLAIHLRLLDESKRAIQKLYDDPSATEEIKVESLYALFDDITDKIDQLKREIRIR